MARENRNETDPLVINDNPLAGYDRNSGIRWRMSDGSFWNHARGRETLASTMLGALLALTLLARSLDS